MTRKDYTLIATAVAEAYRLSVITTGNETAALIARNAYAQCLAHTLARDNPRFDRERFLAACGVKA